MVHYFSRDLLVYMAFKTLIGLANYNGPSEYIDNWLLLSTLVKQNNSIPTRDSTSGPCSIFHIFCSLINAYIA
jgi:hypothetical protein